MFVLRQRKKLKPLYAEVASAKVLNKVVGLMWPLNTQTNLSPPHEAALVPAMSPSPSYGTLSSCYRVDSAIARRLFDHLRRGNEPIHLQITLLFLVFELSVFGTEKIKNEDALKILFSFLLPHNCHTKYFHTQNP